MDVTIMCFEHVLPKKGHCAFEQPSAYGFPLQFPQLDVRDSRVHEILCFQLSSFLSAPPNNSIDATGSTLFSVNHTLQVHRSTKSLHNGEDQSDFKIVWLQNGL